MPLTVKGRVKGAGGVVYPPRLYFGYVDDANGINKKLFYILRRPGVDVLSVTCDLPFVTCFCSWRKNVAFEIGVSLTNLPDIGPFSGTIKIITNDPETEYSEIEVPVSGVVELKSEDNLTTAMSNYN